MAATCLPTLPLLQPLAKALDSHLTIDLDEENPSFVFRPIGEPCEARPAKKPSLFGGARP
ncbi:hypothetical protein [Streptomyces sp. NBC_01361]|uniref:hypothetical protein n=1 Tax=Streptomyces sp. NBC_01361 TaxID=2903838 RepID=UPI002E37B90C|nr:hypothetical protein [Streptomyces sp. NBC_01361]